MLTVLTMQSRWRCLMRDVLMGQCLVVRVDRPWQVQQMRVRVRARVSRSQPVPKLRAEARVTNPTTQHPWPFPALAQAEAAPELLAPMHVRSATGRLRSRAHLRLRLPLFVMWARSCAPDS